ncbi:MAG: ATP-binding cassette domain-containing protein [Pseudomonadales bacterium]|nr:ATP-binding cassette domain-containing protein [Pseudomonadales bacterium]
MTECEQNSIEIRDLQFSRGDRKIFDGIDMDIQRGKVTAIMGPSGCGKTTLLRLLGAQLKPDAGSIWLGDKNIPQLKRKELFEVRKRIGMLFQSGALFSDLSLYENVAFPLRVHTELPDDMIRDLVLMKLHAVGLRGARDLMPSELSGGMARRAALARAIALDPEIIMYDEPFAGQDPISMGVLVRLIRLLNKAIGITSIIVSHDLQETASIADYIYIIANGKVIGEGTPDQVMTDRSEMVHQFTHGTSDGPVPFHFPAPEYSKEIMGLQDV